jgi:nucleotide-binding universal stress UspA family protein
MQKLKDILVYIDDGASNKQRVITAVSLAKLHGARLTAVTLAAVKPSHLKVKDAKTLAVICEQEAHKRVEEFSQYVKEQQLEVNSRVIHGEENEAARKIAQYARNFDLVILRQANPGKDNFSIVEKVSEQVILLSGRPVFFMPYIGAHRIPCVKAMIAWDGSPTTTRATHDALALLSNVEEVILLVVQQGKQKTAKGELLANDMKKHLKRHGVNASVKRTNAGTFDVPTVLLNEIAENDIDLLVMGGYGTPSLKQKIFGGVTRTILSSMIIPVIMSH